MLCRGRYKGNSIPVLRELLVCWGDNTYTSQWALMCANDRRAAGHQRTGALGADAMSRHGQWSACVTFTPPPDAHGIRRVEGLRLTLSLLTIWAEGPAPVSGPMRFPCCVIGAEGCGPRRLALPKQEHPRAFWREGSQYTVVPPLGAPWNSWRLPRINGWGAGGHLGNRKSNNEF